MFIKPQTVFTLFICLIIGGKSHLLSDGSYDENLSTKLNNAENLNGKISRYSGVSKLRPLVIPGEFGKKKTVSLNRTTEFLFEFLYNASSLKVRNFDNLRFINTFELTHKIFEVIELCVKRSQRLYD